MRVFPVAVVFVAATVVVGVAVSPYVALALTVAGATAFVFCLRGKIPAPSSVTAKLESAPAIEVIRARQSWRSYGREPSESQLARLRQYVLRDDVCRGPIEGSHVTIVVVRRADLSGRRQLGTYGFISGAKCFLVGVLRKDQSPADFGAVFERVVLEATRMGLCTCWLGGSFSGSGFTEAAREAGVSFAEGDRVLIASPLGCPLDDSSLLRMFLLNSVSADKKTGRTPRHTYSMLFTEDSGDALDVTKLPQAFKDAADAVRLSPSAGNMQPWRIVHSASGAWHFFSTSVGYTKHFGAHDCGIAACHWEQVLAQHGVTGRWSVLSSDVPREPVPSSVYRFSWLPHC